MIKAWLRGKLRELLGLDEDRNAKDYDLASLSEDIHDVNTAINALGRSIHIYEAALGRIIAKLDPMFGKPEVPGSVECDKRKAESDRLASEDINRFYAEERARKHTEGKE